MGSFSIWHLLIVAAMVFLLFGRGKVSDVMGDFAKGIKNFRHGLRDLEGEDEPRALAAENRVPEYAERPAEPFARR